MSRFLGLDYGERRIGVALSDEMGWTASPLPPVERVGDRKDVARIRALVEAHEVVGVVVGLPLHLDGRPGERAERTLEFVARLRKSLAVPVETWDERLTTREAERRLIEADVSRARRRQVVDGLAASLILQGYLDRRQARLENPS